MKQNPEQQLQKLVQGLKVTPRVTKFMMRQNEETDQRDLRECLRYGNFIALYDRKKVAHIPTGLLIKEFDSNLHAVMFCRIISSVTGWDNENQSELEATMRGTCKAAINYVVGNRLSDSTVENLIRKINVSSKQKEK